MNSSREQSPVDAGDENARRYERPEDAPHDESQQLAEQRQQQHLLDMQHERQQRQQLLDQRQLVEATVPHFAVEEETQGVASASASASASDAAYEADVDDVDMPIVADNHKHEQVARDVAKAPYVPAEMSLGAQQRRQAERQHIYELFQPWALKNYGDQAKTKTITLRKKTRILKALEGKEHSRPDSSKFRFWVKTKAFTTKRPAEFKEAAGGHRQLEPLPPNAVLSDNPSLVDLFVASTTKDFGKRTYRKVAVVEEFFDIIYNVHMELGGRSGMHAGQKRTYRIITETYAFLPREAVTRFLSICPECKKNLRATSPATSINPPEDCGNESSSEVEGLNYSSHTESSVEAGPTKTLTKGAATSITTAHTVVPLKRRYSQLEEASDNTKFFPASQSIARALLSAPSRQPLAAPASLPRSISTDTAVATATAAAPIITIDLVSERTTSLSKPTPTTLVGQPKIRINPQLQRPLTPPPVPASVSVAATVSSTSASPSPSPLVVREPVTHAPPSYLGYHPLCFDMNFLKTHESFFRYYEMMRRFYAGGFPLPLPPMPAEFTSVAELLTPQRNSNSGVSRGSGIIPASGNVKQPAVQQECSAISENPSIHTKPIDIQEPLIKKFKSSPESEKTLRLRTNATESQARETTSASTVAAAVASSTAAELEMVTETMAPMPPLSPPPTQLSAINLSIASTFRSTRSNGTSTSHTKPLPTLPHIVIPTTPLTLASSALSELVTSTPTALKSNLSSALSFKSSTTEVRASSSKYKPSGGADNRPTPSSTSRYTSRLPPLDLERLKPITSTYLQLTRSMGLSDEDALRFDNLVSNDFNYTL
ncbi:uncharacterized protein LOC126753596 [Bactrocera neohumeralis]|uniref:uncharacterized protein LOC126753596 n=1 Tax=Bactrocera neohumeralis TaxID=98809 RepID=UPI00216533D4|nr:uncharacterized protein LOC126753596 [Bactrocera neohumeralis]